MKFKGDPKTDVFAKMKESYGKNYKSVSSNPAIQRLLNSNRKYYVKKGLKKISKAKNLYLQDIVKLAKEAYIQGIHPAEVVKALCPDIPEFLEKLLEHRPDILDTVCPIG